MQPECTLEGAKLVHPEGATATAPLSSLDPLRDPEEKETTLVSGKPDRVHGGDQHLVDQGERILAELNAATGMRFKAWHPNGELTANGRLVLALLQKGYSMDQLVRVVRLKCRNWKESEMAKFLRPKTLFCPTNFAQYVAGLAEPVQTSAPEVRP